MNKSEFVIKKEVKKINKYSFQNFRFFENSYVAIYLKIKLIVAFIF
jgi:hypothetical protein